MRLRVFKTDGSYEDLPAIESGGYSYSSGGEMVMKDADGNVVERRQFVEAVVSLDMPDEVIHMLMQPRVVQNELPDDHPTFEEQARRSWEEESEG